MAVALAHAKAGEGVCVRVLPPSEEKGNLTAVPA